MFPTTNRKDIPMSFAMIKYNFNHHQLQGRQDAFSTPCCPTWQCRASTLTAVAHASSGNMSSRGFKTGRAELSQSVIPWLLAWVAELLPRWTPTKTWRRTRLLQPLLKWMMRIYQWKVSKISTVYVSISLQP